ncbi:DNA polymerase-1 [Salibacterium qingdaonense]|uniref:DNA polymerase I n=2 Tax=Salibacterium qingdaonense TaxID=266892 RepID=A0A1I4NYC0_9BACI|nr:DNA polymerase-1 [Salibacterium qingdaonense]
MDALAVLQDSFDISLDGNDLVLHPKAALPEDRSTMYEAMVQIKQHKANAVYRLNAPSNAYANIVAFDLETSDLDPLKGEIKLISVWGDGVEKVTSDVYEVEELLRDPSILKVCHNASFDVTFLRTKGITITSYMDTLVMAQVFHNRVKTDNSLKGLAEKYLGRNLNKNLQHADHWQGDLTEDHYAYALLDAQVALELYYFLQEQITHLHLDVVLKREMAAIDTIIELNRNGIGFDYEGWEQELEYMNTESLQFQETVRNLLETPTLNLQSPAQLMAALGEQGIHVEGTSDEVLAKYEGQYDVIDSLRKYKKRRKQINAYGEKLKQAIGKDGRLRGTWRLMGTDTFRMTCKQPNLQGMPGKAKPYFRPEEGKSFIVADYRTIELRILAELSGDPELKQAFYDNEDLHTKTTAAILNKQEGEMVTAEERKIGKVVNFGLVYGMTKWGLQKKIQGATGAAISLQEAETFRNRYFELYPGVLRYQDRMLQRSFIQTLGGRYWSDTHHMLEKGSIARYNYPIQATSTEGLKEALALFLEGRQKTWKLAAVVHDEIILEVPDTNIEEASVFLNNVMVEGMKTLVKQIPIEVELQSAKYWCK